jgi:hypothetical protein
VGKKRSSLKEMFKSGRIMPDACKGPQWAEWRILPVNSNLHDCPPGAGVTFDIEPVLVPPNTDRYARFEVEFLQDMLHVLLHRAGTALQNFSDLAITLSGSDPFHHFYFALS